MQPFLDYTAPFWDCDLEWCPNLVSRSYLHQVWKFPKALT